MVKRAKQAVTLEMGAVTVSDPTTTVTLTSDKHPRMLIVEYVGEAPKIVFKGDWSVRNLLTLKRCIGREFKLYRRSIIRNTITT